jgi:malate dehydrogenase (oxaloacetate-decarboxylating)
VKELIICDSKGIIYEGRKDGMNPYKDEIAKSTNRKRLNGGLSDAMKGADVFIGVSQGNLVTKDMVKLMNKDAIVFAMANPLPEIMPEDAFAGGAKIYASGRSDFPNQINNVLGFPGIFKGALSVRASKINHEMKIAAANAIAAMVAKPTVDQIIPPALDRNVAKAVSEAVAKAAKSSGVARK